jgi:hypothetical protein
MKFRSTRLALLCVPVLLTGCGDGWEMQLTNTAFPYGNSRTAGSGVVYVLAKMMPEKKEIQLQPIKREMAPAPIQPAPEKMISNDVKK